MANAKVYETSIVPKGEMLEPVRNQEMIASSMTIEVLHIATFFVIFAFIFAGIWKAAVAIERKEKASENSKVTA
ncbi:MULTISPECIES: hypothetical protein [Halobacteriovorax]|uniref:Uncharacterized protein n=1 Tax=Halobacteriovorax vibrionivorans TaxID=2152716 RepID=A0ABY0IIF1_9BACT|nr:MULTISPECIES: hypothetical protein [Halobacteriovorax]RZF21324.1 hypothetical protein DAY19_06465 [Halobacteriovorax vibrionivorans]TGD47918.1 hypothetical protein EP118_05665 [Halobacteriovorax sp. Y22]